MTIGCVNQTNENGALIGDLDGNNDINVNDVVFMQAIIESDVINESDGINGEEADKMNSVFGTNFTSDEWMQIMDIDGDGKINSSDLAILNDHVFKELLNEMSLFQMKELVSQIKAMLDEGRAEDEKSEDKKLEQASNGQNNTTSYAPVVPLEIVDISPTVE